jgi:hypothetical protein
MLLSDQMAAVLILRCDGKGAMRCKYEISTRVLVRFVTLMIHRRNQQTMVTTPNLDIW